MDHLHLQKTITLLEINNKDLTEKAVELSLINKLLKLEWESLGPKMDLKHMLMIDSVQELIKMEKELNDWNTTWTPISTL